MTETLSSVELYEWATALREDFAERFTFGADFDRLADDTMTDVAACLRFGNRQGAAFKLRALGEYLRAS